MTSSQTCLQANSVPPVSQPISTTTAGERPEISLIAPASSSGRCDAPCRSHAFSAASNASVRPSGVQIRYGAWIISPSALW